MLSVLEAIQNMCYSMKSRGKVLVLTEEKFSRYFSLDTVFSSSKNIPADTEIKILDKSWNISPIQRKTNNPEIRSNSEELFRKKTSK